MYTLTGKVRFSECDERGVLTIPGIVNYFQDCSSMQSETIGHGISYLMERKRAWILNSWHIILKRRPNIGEEIEVSTWATGFRGVFGPRNFMMKTKAGEVLAYANSLWVYMNTEKGRPMKPEPEEIAAYEVEPALEMEQVDRKIQSDLETMEVGTYEVRRSQIDTNHHMNNGQYLAVALETMEDQDWIREIRVEYKKSAMLGDKLVVRKAEERDKCIVRLGNLEKEYAIIEWIGEKKE